MAKWSENVATDHSNRPKSKKYSPEKWALDKEKNFFSFLAGNLVKIGLFLDHFRPNFWPCPNLKIFNYEKFIFHIHKTKKYVHFILWKSLKTPAHGPTGPENGGQWPGPQKNDPKILCLCKVIKNRPKMAKLGENRQSAQAHGLPRPENAGLQPTRARKRRPVKKMAQK